MMAKFMHRVMERIFTTGVLLVLLLVSNASAQQPIQSQPLIPNETQLDLMIKTALIALDNANLTGNYSVLRDMAAPGFREFNTTAQLAEIFQKIRKDKLNIAPIVLFKPRFARSPWIDDRRRFRVLNLAGLVLGVLLRALAFTVYR